MTLHESRNPITDAHIDHLKRMRRRVDAHALNMILDRLQDSVISAGRYTPPVTLDGISTSARSYMLGAEYAPIQLIFIRLQKQMSTLQLATAMMQLGRPPNRDEAERILQHFSWGLRRATMAELHGASDEERLGIEIFVRPQDRQGHPFREPEPLFLYRMRESARPFYPVMPVAYRKRVFPVLLT